MRVYVAGSSKEIPRVRAMQATLVALGCTITHDWTKQVEDYGAGADQLSAADKRRFARLDLDGIANAAMVVFLQSPVASSRGMWVEIGYAVACRERLPTLLFLCTGGGDQLIWHTLMNGVFEKDEEFLDKVARVRVPR